MAKQVAAAVSAAADQTVDKMEAAEGVDQSPADMTPGEMADLLLGKEQAKAKAEEEKDETAGASAAGATTTTTTRTEEKEEEKPAAAAQPGTPDKVAQQLQQDLAALSRKHDRLLEKIEAGELLTPAEKKEAKESKRKIDGIKEALAAKGKDFDLLEHEADVAGSLLEQDERIGKLERELEAERADRRREREAAEKQTDAQRWAAVKKSYEGVAVEEVWDKVVAETMARLGIDAAEELTPRERAMVQNAATGVFHDRCAIAKKSVDARRSQEAAAAEEAKKKKAGKIPPPTTEGGGRTSSGAGPVNAAGNAAPDVNDPAEYRRLAAGLVREEE